MADLLHFEDHGNGVYEAKFADGSAYGVHVNVDDPSPTHKALVNEIKSGKAEIKPRVRDLASIVAYLEMRIDSIATEKLKIPLSGVDALQKAKLDEARDVVDMLDSQGEAVITALSPDELSLRYPLLWASGRDVAATARLVQAKALDQRRELSKIESWRLGAKRAIREAPNADLAELAFMAAIQ